MFAERARRNAARMLLIAIAAGCGGGFAEEGDSGDTADELRKTCPADENPCTVEHRASGRCVSRPVADGTACAGGTCQAGSCVAPPPPPPIDPPPADLAALVAYPASLAFGDVRVGQSASKTVQITNGGGQSATFSAAASVVGNGVTVSGLAAGALLAPGQTATLNVRFAPTSAGAVSGSVSLASDAQGSPLVIPLTGRGVELPAGAVPAFPGAEGGGAAATGGRGGSVIFVTNLNDSGPGSLRAACAASGKRTVVFRVGGVIRLLSSIHILSPDITIAGQTAPGGIALYLGDAKPSVTVSEPYAFSVEASNVIIRYVRVWGDIVYNPGGFSSDRFPEGNASSGSIAFAVYAPNVIVDHCDMLWTTHEAIATMVGSPTRPGANLTFQHNLIAEGVRDPALNPHSYSLAMQLLDANANHDPAGVTDLDVHHNFIASLSHRVPGITAERARFVNNLVYNVGRYAAIDADPRFTGMSSLDFVGNDYREGPWGNPAGYREVMVTRGSVALGTAANFSIHASGNRSDFLGYDVTWGDRGGLPAGSSDDLNWQRLVSGSAVFQGPGLSGFVPLPGIYRRASSLPAPASGFDLTVDRAEDLIPLLTGPGGAGASRYLAADGAWVENRDSAQLRIIRDLQTGTGPAEPPTSAAKANGGALPTLPSVPAPADANQDGIPDEWARQHGYDPAGSGYATNVRADGYTVLEDYLNGH